MLHAAHEEALTDWEEEWAEFNPIFGDQSSWWRLSPNRVIKMLATMGFADVEVKRHHQHMRPRHDLDLPFEAVEFYTIIANRTALPFP